jgi:hypothetical protein
MSEHTSVDDRSARQSIGAGRDGNSEAALPSADLLGVIESRHQALPTQPMATMANSVPLIAGGVRSRPGVGGLWGIWP